ncbi:Hypothetical predicted protein [Mytilus galloprovincialis]|uniref:Uncharacterized protein n=1 Tax=Mytilus galloprovincialis TaxID=29158 RepID=A0A8B6DQ46_MYTGA|nr:Hypothetical predicted protein [Mytilus galloprovincialis]
MSTNFIYVLVVLSAYLMISSALPYGFHNFRPSYRGGYGFGDIGGTYSRFPGFGGAYSAFPAYSGIHQPHNTVNYHRHVTPYSYGGRGFLNNFFSGSTLPSMALGFLVGKAL